MTISTITFNSVNVGSAANDGTGDDLRTAFQKVNANFGFMSNTGFNAGNILVSNELDAGTANVGNVIVSGGYVPASNTAPGTPGQIVWNSGNIYVCVATNTWKRASLSTF
jgi:hypothetical protein